MSRYLLLLSIAVPLCAQFDLRPPSFGCHTDASGRMRRLEGVRASLVASPVVEGVASGLCNSWFAVYQSGAQVILSTGDETYPLPLPEGAKLALDEQMAIAASPATGELHYWREGAWHLSPANVDAGLRSLRVRGGKASLLFNDRLISIDVVSGAVEGSAPGPTGASVASLVADGSILTIVDERWMHCSDSGCSDLGSAPVDVDSLVPLNGEWLAAATKSGTVHAVRVDQGRVETFLLPGSAQGSSQE